jgi:hypothetical protein
MAKEGDAALVILTDTPTRAKRLNFQPHEHMDERGKIHLPATP